MCGILVARRAAQPREALSGALRLMAGRGPDAEDELFESGDVYLGHRRLAILDPHPRANQPFRSGPLTIVFNGEVYNYRELISEHGLDVRTRCDTEVVLEMYARLGPDCLRYLNGMFALAIWDERRRELFVARDRLGIKPLFHSDDGLFASEVAPLLELLGPRELDEVALRQYRKLRMTTRDHSFYRGISVFPAGHYWLEGRLVRYWDLDTSEKPPPDDEELRWLIEDAVRLRSRADVAVGALLSGGLDSAIVTGLLRPADTWVAGLTEENEFAHARLAAQHLGTTHHEIAVDPQSFAQTAQSMIARRREPLCVPNEVLLYRAAAEIRQHNRVLLCGEGADELFFGYDRIFRWAEQTSHLDVHEFHDRYGYGSERDLEIVDYALEDVPGHTPLERVAWFFQIRHLHGLLRRLDFATMAHGLEARVPFLDHRLVDRVAGTAFEWRMGERSKEPLRRIFKDLLPEEIATRPKLGFPVPLERLRLGRGDTPMDRWFDFNLTCLNAPRSRAVEPKRAIRDYWQERPPQTWYSAKQPGTPEYFNELAYKRYSTYYPYIPEVAEFSYHRGERVLEVGVGVGTDLVQYARHGARVSGVDLTPGAIETTRRHLRAFGLEAQCLAPADAERLPFADGAFDLVYSFGVLHHTPDPAKAIAEIQRVLKPCGKAIVMLYAPGWKHWLKRLLLHGVLRGELRRYGYQETVNRNSEVHGGSPLTYVMRRGSVRRCFAPFGVVDITRHRLGEYFDYAPYGTRKLPAPVTRALYAIGAESWLGENWLIKAEKREAPPRVSFWSTLSKP